MKKMQFIGFAVCIPLLLTSCALDMSHTSVKSVSEKKLADGSKVMVGFKAPESSSKCLQLAKKSDSWEMNKLKGTVKWGGGYQVFMEQAIDYANQNHLKTNYIFLNVPDETSINGFNLHPFAEASAVYYSCKNPPAVSDKIF